MRRRKKKQQAPEMSSGDALTTVAERSPEALKAVGDVMDANARTHNALLHNLIANAEKAHSETRVQLRDATHELHDLQERVAWLMGGPLPASLRHEIESIIEDEVTEIELLRMR